MADCSASGTTIDRAAAVLLQAGGGGGSGTTAAAAAAAAAAAGKHLSALLGHATASNAVVGGGTIMPMAAPQSLAMPSSIMAKNGDMATVGTMTNHHHPHHRHPSQGTVVPMTTTMNHLTQQQNISQRPVTMTMMNPHQALHHQQQQQYHQQQQQQHQFFLMQQQQQQQQQQHQAMTMMMMQQQQQQQQQQRQQQQQQQLMRRQRQQQRQSQQAAAVAAAKAQQHASHAGDSTRHLSVDNWHDTLEEDVTAELLLGHEGLVHGARMEELASAWAQAEAEYEAEDGALNALDSEGARGASMEELAAAWAQAEAEYEAEYTKNEERDIESNVDLDYGNLWQGDSYDDDATTSLFPSLDQQPVAPYEFVNSVSAETDMVASSRNTNYMEEGMEAFQQGRLKEAIQSFEMELQVQNRNNATAWKMLGQCHAESDQDQKAIQCLEEAVKIDPFSPDSLLALAVSHLNELNHERALTCMKEFLTHNPKYAGMDELISVGDETARNTRTAFDEVKKMLVAAADYDPTDSADVHEALGVLYNVSKEYDLASHSFREALKNRQDLNNSNLGTARTTSGVHQLWNKLGATLANGGQSDQALPAYHQALQIKPKYARAWLNMAISYSNLQEHDEAARCYLQTLSLNPDATHCWTYLRMALSSNERWDLLPLVFSQDLKAFQDHFDFVLY